MERPGSRKSSRSGRRAQKRTEVVARMTRDRRLAIRHREPAAGVQELQPHAGGGLHLGDDVERGGDGLPVRLDARDLRADVQVHARRLQVRVPGRQPERGDGVVAVDAGLAAVGGLEAGVRERGHVHVDARGHGRHFALCGCDLADASEFMERVDHEGAHAAGDCALYLGLRLGDAVEDDLPRLEPRRQRLVELAAGVDLDARAGMPHRAEEPQIGAGLARVEDLGGRVHTAKRAHHSLDVGPHAALAEHEEGRLAGVRQFHQISAVEAQVSVADGVQRIGGRHALPLLVEWAVSEVYCARFVPPATGDTDRVVDASPHDRRRTAFTGGKVHDF
jgi:hypothetical protein